MTTLKLAIDASGARQGAREFETAADQVGRSAEKAGKTVDIYFGTGSVINRSMDEASKKTGQFAKTVEAVGEATQIQQRVRLLGEEVRNLGSGMGSAASIGQTLSGALIDIAQISGKVEGGFGGFINLLKANPLLIAATVIGSIATAMSLFGDETNEANQQLEKQIRLQEELRNASVDFATQYQKNLDLRRVGFQIDEREIELSRARKLAEVASSLAGQEGFQSFADLTALTGLSQQELVELAGRRGVQQKTERFDSNVRGTGSITTDIGLTNEAAREIILKVAQIFRNQAVLSPQEAPFVQGLVQAPPVAAAGPSGPYGPPAPRAMSAGEREAYQMQFKPIGYEMRVNEEQQRARLLAEELDRLNERLQQLKSLGQDVGQAIGGAFFSIVNGAANARQALAALLQQFVAIAQQRAIQGIANSIGNAFGASTQQQINNLGTGNTSVSVPSTAGGGTAGGGLA